MTEVTEIFAQPGPQAQFLKSNADIAIYGGEAGGGKSFALLLEPLYDQHNPKFGAAIFRRTSPQLTGAGSLWEDAQELYRPFGASMPTNPTLRAEFPSGAMIQFLHLQHVDDVYNHQGKQYAYIGFDELTHFEARQFWYMVSRLRTTSGAMVRMRGTTNPDPDSFVRKLISWWIGNPDCGDCDDGSCEEEEHGYPNPERSGIKRWFVRGQSGELIWADTPKELKKHCKEGQHPLSLVFIRAGLRDNPALTSKDPGYESRVLSLDEVEVKRLAKGNWNTRPAAGRYIKKPWFKRRHSTNGAGLPPMNIYICSDYAVTEPENEEDEPDYTEHGVFGITPNDDIYVLDWWSGQTTSDVWVEELCKLIKKYKPVCTFGEMGIIQKAVEPHLKKRMQETKAYSRTAWLTTATGRLAGVSSKQGFRDRSKQAKAARGRAFQARASMGKFVFPVTPWAERVIKQCVKFPIGKDDAFDVMSHMALAIDQAHPAVLRQAPKKGQRRDYDKNERHTGISDGDWKTA